MTASSPLSAPNDTSARPLKHFTKFSATDARHEIVTPMECQSHGPTIRHPLACMFNTARQKPNVSGNPSKLAAPLVLRFCRPKYPDSPLCGRVRHRLAAIDVACGATALHWAAALGDEDTTRLMLASGSDVEVCCVGCQGRLSRGLCSLRAWVPVNKCTRHDEQPCILRRDTRSLWLLIACSKAAVWLYTVSVQC